MRKGGQIAESFALIGILTLSCGNGRSKQQHTAIQDGFLEL